jgi:glycerol-3-phosphate acyltransferase PlsY
MTILHFTLVAVLGYLLGGIPTAYIAGRLMGVDIRQHGSGNVGATNAIRVLGAKVGLPVMVIDMGKGYVAAALLPQIPVSGADLVYLSVIGGAAAVFGHVFTPYLDFRGGKGVAATVGMLAAVAPIPAASCLGVFLPVFLATGIVSLGVLLAAIVFPVSVFLFDRYTALSIPAAVQWFAVALPVFLAWTHRSNIRRLIAGQENRFRFPWERPSAHPPNLR